MIGIRIVFAASLFLAVACAEVLAQSGYRGSSTRPSPQMRGSQGRPSRVGGVRSSFPRSARPTGMIDSSRRGQAAGGAQLSRPMRTTGFTSDRAAGSFSPTTRYSGPSSNVTRARPARRPPATSVAISTKLAEEGFRTWADASGRYSIVGKLVAQRANVIWIRRTDGLLAKVSLTQLSAPDQEFVRGTKAQPASSER